jgi:transposase
MSAAKMNSILRVKIEKTDRKDVQLLLTLMMKDRFPQIWVPSAENRDVRQLLGHRNPLLQIRKLMMNQLQALAMNEGNRWKSQLWSEQGRAELAKLALAPWDSCQHSVAGRMPGFSAIDRGLIAIELIDLKDASFSRFSFVYIDRD